MDCPLYLSSISTSASADILRRRRAKGTVLYGEVTAAGLACDGGNYWNKCWRHAAGFVCSPPLREGETAGLLEAAAGGDVDVVASQHAAFNTKQKALGKDNFINIPNGITGVEERMKVLWDKGFKGGKLTASRFVELTSAGPAKLLNIYPQKGRVAVGSDADIVIWDPSLSKTITKEEHISKCDFNIFEGMEVTGGPDYVIYKGRMVLDEGTFRPMQGFGQFVGTPPFAPSVYDRVKERKESAKIEPVARSEQDMAIINGTGDIPPPTPPPAQEKPANQQRSSFDLTSHPQTPDFDSPEVRSSPSRSSVRVRAPPGGRSSGGFW